MLLVLFCCPIPWVTDTQFFVVLYYYTAIAGALMGAFLNKVLPEVLLTILLVLLLAVTANST
jgi:uncharacterized membrane protein YfcA